MSRTTGRWLRLLAAAAAGTILIAGGIAIERNLLSGSDGGSHLEPSSREPDSHADGSEEPSALVELSAQALDNIGLTTWEVGLGPVETTLRFPGSVRMHPDGIAVLSTRIQGKIVSVSVAPGDAVRKGQVLARIQSLIPGNPPPTVELKAPITGIVARRDAIVGEAAQPNKELIQLFDPRAVVAEARVPERMIEQVRMRQEARVHRLRDHVRWTGRVSFIGSEVDPDTRTYPIWIELTGRGGSTPRPGQFVEILLIESRRTALTVPLASIVEEGPLRFVFVKQEHAFERRLVSTGAEDDQSVEILSGVAEGDTVAVKGSYELLLALGSGGAGGQVTDESAPHGH